jgi:hypothetical protein
MSFQYYTRILQAYLGRSPSNLSFWHETPEINDRAFETGSRQFYMTFAGKARYAGPFDDSGVPLLDYRGRIGQQYNPIAIAQYGLAAWNAAENDEGGNQATWRKTALVCADWLVANLEENKSGLKVWHHKFDWEYFRVLKSPWYSGLAQGQGISLLVRAFHETGDHKYKDAAEAAFRVMVTRIEDGGILFVDETGDWWIEEYVTTPPTHILNGFMWALWGVYDFDAFTGSKAARGLWDKGVATIEKNLGKFDSGFWSLYDLAPLSMRNPASGFYHALHVVQLRVMHKLTGQPVFHETAERWQGYAERGSCRRRAFFVKVLFKLLHY